MTRRCEPAARRRPDTTAAPGVAAVLHEVFVVAQVVDVQQPVDRHVQDLHEAAELHHRGDEPLEGLADALL